VLVVLRNEKARYGRVFSLILHSTETWADFFKLQNKEKERLNKLLTSFGCSEMVVVLDGKKKRKSTKSNAIEPNNTKPKVAKKDLRVASGEKTRKKVFRISSDLETDEDTSELCLSEEDIF
jgi:hypothetical protein